MPGSFKAFLDVNFKNMAYSFYIFLKKWWKKVFRKVRYLSCNSILSRLRLEVNLSYKARRKPETKVDTMYNCICFSFALAAKWLSMFQVLSEAWE